MLEVLTNKNKLEKEIGVIKIAVMGVDLLLFANCYENPRISIDISLRQ